MTGSTQFPQLNQPWNLGDLQLKNRIVMASLTRNRNLVPNQINIDYYVQRASAGLILSEGILIEPQGTEWPDAPGIWSKKQINAWKLVTDAVHNKGGVIFAQLWHLGRISNTLHNAGQAPPAPSAIGAAGGKFRLLAGAPGYSVPHEIEDPNQYIELFKQAAINAKEAGFDGVELHSASGYLCHQFLDSFANQRTDKFGGSIQNRSKFVLDCIDKLCEVYPSSRVGIKLTPSGGFNDVGEKSIEPTKELYTYLIEELDNRNIGYIQLSRYLPAFDPLNRGTPMDLTYFVKFIKNSKIIFNGEFSAEESNKYIEEGLTTAVAIGRGFISNPDLVFRMLNNKELTLITDYSTLYTFEIDCKQVGYTDYPFHSDNIDQV